jgi:hypothetical protein
VKHSYFYDENQLEKWISAAEDIRDELGIEKALGYIIGEKFYNLVADYRFEQEFIFNLNKKRKSPGYEPVVNVSGSEKKINLDEEYTISRRKAIELKEILADFAELISVSFNRQEIEDYLNSGTRLGTLGHTATEETHKLFIEKGVVEHSLDTEIDDSLILGDMMKYFGLKD